MNTNVRDCISAKYQPKTVKKDFLLLKTKSELKIKKDY